MIGSIAISATMFFLGKKDAAHFIGQWGSTILALALFNKLLHPSGEATDLAGAASHTYREAVKA